MKTLLALATITGALLLAPMAIAQTTTGSKLEQQLSQSGALYVKDLKLILH
jgi:hypothetical protein